MTPARRRAVVLSSFDLSDAPELLRHGCEDCACPVSDRAAQHAQRAAPPVTAADPRRWVRGADVVEMQLDPEHQLLFNPAGRGGVVVVNEPAHEILRCFQQPTTIQDAQATWPEAVKDAGEVLTRLSQFDVIHPAGHLPAREFSRSETLTAWLHVTNACNLRCPYCYVSKSSEGMTEHTGHTAVEAVIRSAVTHGFHAVKLKYAGGEASLNHHLMMSMHAHARALAAQAGLELHATLLSNGVKLSSALIKALQAERIQVMISLDGVGPQHDIQRPFANGKPSFHLVERTIGQLIELGHPPHLSITVTNRNASGLAEVVRFALERELTFSFNFFRDNDCAANFPDLRYQEETMISAMLDAFGVIEELLPRWSVLGSVLDRGQLLQPRQRSCGVGQDYVVIDQKGRVAKCHMEIERTLGEIFSDDPLQLVQRDRSTVQNLPVEEKEGCRDCTWRYWCSGGCAVATFKATGRYDIKSPNCNIYKAIYPRALRLEGLRLLKYATLVAGGTPPASR
jgi:uncharacterized protein